VEKRIIAERYEEFFNGTAIQFFKEPDYAQSNYWLNAIICPSEEFRNNLLDETNSSGVMTRPIWKLLHRLPMFAGTMRDDLSVSKRIEGCLVNLPSSPIEF
jgi:dTDP-4-amino-4,6-dideoxygalactose transaminase